MVRLGKPDINEEPTACKHYVTYCKLTNATVISIILQHCVPPNVCHVELYLPDKAGILVIIMRLSHGVISSSHYSEADLPAADLFVSDLALILTTTYIMQIRSRSLQI